MSGIGYACAGLTLLLGAGAAWWAGFLSGRRYESGIWERWLDRAEEEQEDRTARRGVRLKSMRIRR